MGMEIIRLGDSQSKSINSGEGQALAELHFAVHNVPKPPLSIWMMSSTAGQPLFPWWAYDSKIDEDLKRLNDLWSVTSAQSFFDCLFLSQLKRTVGQNFYVILPGYLRTEGWASLPEAARNSYLRGQGCVYRLEGSFNSKLSINWVPFAQPQCVIKDLNFASLWPMFVASRNEDVANSIGFFSLSDSRRLPLAISQLIQPNDNRSVDLSNIVDWFGLYTSPISPDHAACAVVYAKENEKIGLFTNFQAKFQSMLSEIRTMMKASPAPHTAFRILSRYIPL